jgi:hypothetical protein
MHRLKNALFAAMMVAAVGSVSACSADRVVLPLVPVLRPGIGSSTADSTIVRDIAIVRAALVDLNTKSALGGSEAALANQQIVKLKELLGTLEKKLATGVSRVVVGEGNPSEEPVEACVLVGPDLSDCFLFWDHRTRIDGTGFISQVTSVFGSQSAVVSILLDGQLIQRPIGTTGYSAASNGLAQPYFYNAPNCNQRSHTVSSTATHMVSASHIAVGGLSVSSSGSMSSDSPAEACEMKGLGVVITPGTIALEGQADISVSNAVECGLASVSASPSNIVSFMDVGGNRVLATGIAVGTASISVRCGTQTGSGSITVTRPKCTDPEASNYGQNEQCTYPEPEPDPGPGGGYGGESGEGCYTLFESYDGGRHWFIVGYTPECGMG